MQHEVFRNSDRRAGSVYPLVVVLQADIVEADTRIVAPLTTTEIVPNPPTRALPLVSHDGRVGEGTNANVAFLAAGRVVTPSVDGLLPGVCRAALLDSARELGVAVESRPVALAELVDAEGVLLTSSPRGLAEVLELDDRRLRPMPRDLLAALP